jgi:hypothetical protein
MTGGDGAEMQDDDAAGEMVLAGQTEQNEEPGNSAAKPWRHGRQKEMFAFPSEAEKKPGGQGRKRVLLAFEKNPDGAFSHADAFAKELM